MIKKVLKALIVLAGFTAGFSLIYLLKTYFQPINPTTTVSKSAIENKNKIFKKEIIGFLPYWLINKAKDDYSKYITDLTYFGLTLDTDGTILKLTNPRENEPGWYTLKSGKLNNVFDFYKKKKIALSLLIFAGSNKLIETLIEDPVQNSKNMVNDLVPILQEYGFSGLNLDIEYTKEASNEARARFTEFATGVKNGLKENGVNSLTIDVTGYDIVKNNLINIKEVSEIADRILIMAYDFHFPGSFVTGPIGPLWGAGSIAEYDTETAVREALRIMPSEKIILGLPLYGYEWETIGREPRFAVIPNTGVLASGRRVEEIINSCQGCTRQSDTDAQESYLIYKNDKTGTYHQIFYPDRQSTLAKTNFAKIRNLGGVALWALGYEDSTILDPLKDYSVK